MAPTRYEAASARGAHTRRDLALDRVGKVTKRIAVATVASVGILGLYVSRSLPGHASTPAVQTPATTTPTTSPPAAGSSGSSAPQTAPAAPVSPPTTTPQRVHVTTGAS